VSIRQISGNNPGMKMLLMGNEAIVRGAVEAGVKIATAYPGTPSSEIGNTFSRIAEDANMYFEWSANEKVAFEVAYGASICGQRSMVSMKHVGLNVALDVLNAVSLRGVNGGFVFISTDDPSQHSSRTEQDNRWLARQNNVPVLEPTSPEEAKDIVKYAYELSEKVGLPVMVRTVTRLSHMRSDVTLGEIEKIDRKSEFDWDGFSYRVAGFEKLFRRHKERHEKIDKVKNEFEKLGYNKIKLTGSGKIGIIGVGFSFNYCIDALKNLGLEDEVSYLKLVTPYPLPENLIVKLLSNVQTLLVTEEVDPFVETNVRSIAKDIGLNVKIIGRMSGHLPREGELSPMILDETLTKLMEIPLEIIDRDLVENEVKEILFDRMLTLCAGCPHRASLYALKKAVIKVKGNEKGVVVNGDIGCYGLAHAPPIAFEDTYFCMGASIGVSQGMDQLGIDTIAWIGDGTFFHSGIPALINAVVNNTNIKIVVADNGTTAMTGFQPTPQTGLTAMGKPTKKLLIEDIAKAAGVEHIEVVDPYYLDITGKAFESMLNSPGVAMVIVRRNCAMEVVRAMRPNKPVPYEVKSDECVGCKLCVNTYGCPALVWSEDTRKISIDSSICIGCGVCSQVCPQNAIHRGGQ